MSSFSFKHLKSVYLLKKKSVLSTFIACGIWRSAKSVIYSRIIVYFLVFGKRSSLSEVNMLFDMPFVFSNRF